MDVHECCYIMIETHVIKITETGVCIYVYMLFPSDMFHSLSK